MILHGRKLLYDVEKQRDNFYYRICLTKKRKKKYILKSCLRVVPEQPGSKPSFRCPHLDDSNTSGGVVVTASCLLGWKERVKPMKTLGRIKNGNTVFYARARKIENLATKTTTSVDEMLLKANARSKKTNSLYLQQPPFILSDFPVVLFYLSIILLAKDFYIITNTPVFNLCSYSSTIRCNMST